MTSTPSVQSVEQNAPVEPAAGGCGCGGRGCGGGQAGVDGVEIVAKPEAQPVSLLAGHCR